jgi:hypothetical protein
MVAGDCECGNEPSEFHKMREISRLAGGLLDSVQSVQSR